MKRLILMLLFAATSVLIAANTQADYYWYPQGQGGPYGGTGVWDSGVKWYDSSAGTYKAWADNNFARFAGTAGTVTNNSARTAGLVFSTDGYVLEGTGLITLLNSSWALRVTNTSGALGTIINSNLAIAGSSTEFNNFNTSAPLTINGIIYGSGSGSYTVTMNGGTGANGTIVLAGANTFTDKIVFKGGVVSVSSVANAGLASNLGAGLPQWAAGLTFDGGTLRYTGASGSTDRWFKINDGKVATIDVTNASTTLTLAGQFSSNGYETTGSLVKTGAGTLRLSGTNYFTGSVTISAGSLSVSTINNGGVAGNLGKSSAAASNLVLDGGTLYYTGTSETTDRAFTITNGKSGTISVATGSGLTIAGSSAATTGQLIKAGSGTLTLAATNNYSGGTVINAGQLRITNSNALGSGSITIAGAYGNKLAFDFAPGSVVNIANNIWIHDQGVTSGSNSELRIYQSSASNDPVTVRLTGILSGGNASQLYCLGSSGVAGYDNTVLILDNPNNTFAGRLYVPRGWLGVSANGVLGNSSLYITANTPTSGLRFYADNLNITNNITCDSGGLVGAVDTQGYTATISGIISGGSWGNLYKVGSGKLILTGNNTFTGGIVFKEGIVSVANIAPTGTSSNLGAGSVALTFDGGALEYTGASTSTNRSFTINNGKVATIDVTNANTMLTLSGQFNTSSSQTTGALLKTGLGTLKLTGTSYYTGTTTVAAGSLIVDGSLALSSGVVVQEGASLAGRGTVSIISGAGSVNPGNSPGILTVETVDPTGGLDFSFEFTSTGSPTYSDASASVNDVLRIRGTNPSTAALTSENAVNLYLGVSNLKPGDVFRGGFYVDVAGNSEGLAAFFTAIKDASFNYYIYGDGAGTHNYGGVNYYTLEEFNNLHSTAYQFAVTTVAETAPFSGGTVDGAVTQFAVVPEPSTITLTNIGILLSLIIYGWRIRK